MEVAFATLAACLGAQLMTEDAEYANPPLYRQARALNRYADPHGSWHPPTIRRWQDFDYALTSRG